jgi:murein DD-endopeptidase MepM/ murein hydrolase activator NlpD
MLAHGEGKAFRRLRDRRAVTIRALMALLAIAVITSTTPTTSPAGPAQSRTPDDTSTVAVVVPGGHVGQYRHGTYPSSGNRTHVGVDIVAPCGSPVLAIESGTVIDRIASRADSDFASLGYMVILRHPASVTGRVHYSLYLHLQGPPTPREQIARGEELGHVGATGHATGCHLHLEVRYFPDRVSARWGNIYGPGDQRDSRYLQENWEDPVAFIARLERERPTAKRQGAGNGVEPTPPS